MEYRELKNKKESELQKLLADARNELMVLRFKDANKQLKDVRDIREKKKEIAQILTVLNKSKSTSKTEEDK